MSEPESGIQIKPSDAKKAQAAKTKAKDLRAAIQKIEDRLGDSKYPSRKQVADLLDKIGKSGASIVPMARW